MSAIVRDVFVGRSDELAVLHDALAIARGGDLRLVLVEGEAGIGKTALLRRFARAASGITTLWASGDEEEARLEFGVVEQVRAQLPRTAPGRHAALPGMDSLAVGADLLAEIGAIEQQGPVVLAIDDLQWVDPASSRALLFVLRRLRRDKVLVVASARPRTIERLGAGWPSVLADGELARVVRLGGLTGGEVRELAAAQGQALPAPSAERLREHTGGNPLYAAALLVELPAGALLDDAAELPAPHSYAATVLSRLARLSPPAQALVTAAAVLGTRAPLRATAEVAGVDDPIGTAEEAVAAGLLDMTGGPADGEASFVHPLMRAAVYDDLSGSRRRALHRAAADVLDTPAAFRHRVAAAAGVDARLAEQLRAAAEQDVATGVVRRAARYFELASRVEPDPEVADVCLYRAVEMLFVAADVPAMGQYVDRVRARAPSAYRSFILAVLSAPMGDPARAIAELGALAEDVSPDEDPQLYTRVTTSLAFLWSLLGEHEQTIRWAGRARAVGGMAPALDSIARRALAWSYARTARVEESLASLADCDPAHAQPAVFETDLLAVRGVVHTWAGDARAAVADLLAVERWMRLGYPATNIPLVYAALAEAQFRAGAWDDAATHVESAVSLAQDLDHAWHLSYAHAVATHLYAARGEDGYAASHAEAAQRTTGSGPTTEGVAYAALADAHRAWAHRNWPAVITALQPLRDSAARDHPNLVLWRYRLAEACIGEGRPDEALTLLDGAPAAPWGGVEAADRARLRALALQRRGDTTGARGAFAAGMADLGGTPVTFTGALLALDYGRFLLDTGEPGSAVAPLRSAREVLLRLGAPRFREACDAALLACGVAADGSPSPAAELDRLTAREQVVARLVASGATNREVAAQLYLSVKGVEYHLGNIYPKLGISSRRQLAAAVATGRTLASED